MEYLGSVLLSAIASGFGGYFGSYLKKKGENLPTKEGFQALKDQTSQLTRATKEIETKIDDQVWNRQRQWEMKRDILLGFARIISQFDQAVVLFGIKIQNRSTSLYGAAEFQKSLEAWNIASNKFEQESYVVGLVVSAQTQGSAI
jgi:hypothetical protein